MLVVETIAKIIPDLHPHLWPAKGKYGLRDYEKVFHARTANDNYDLRGIERAKGCVVSVRPDQHIATVLPSTRKKSDLSSSMPL